MVTLLNMIANSDDFIFTLPCVLLPSVIGLKQLLLSALFPQGKCPPEPLMMPEQLHFFNYIFTVQHIAQKCWVWQAASH